MQESSVLRTAGHEIGRRFPVELFENDTKMRRRVEPHQVGGFSYGVARSQQVGGFAQAILANQVGGRQLDETMHFAIQRLSVHGQLVS